MKAFSAASAAVIILIGAGAAYAADLNTKAPVLKAPTADPATCTSFLDFFTTACLSAAYGVRFYGVIDVSYGYQSHAAGFNPWLPAGFTYSPFKMNSGRKWAVTPNTSSLSNMGFSQHPVVGT